MHDVFRIARNVVLGKIILWPANINQFFKCFSRKNPRKDFTTLQEWLIDLILTLLLVLLMWFWLNINVYRCILIGWLWPGKTYLNKRQRKGLTSNRYHANFIILSSATYKRTEERECSGPSPCSVLRAPSSGVAANPHSMNGVFDLYGNIIICSSSQRERRGRDNASSIL